MTGNSMDKSDILFPRSRYYGKFTPEHLAFNANLQEFAHKVGYICGLETGGKLAPNEAYEMIRELWAKVESSKTGLGIQPEGDNTKTD